MVDSNWSGGTWRGGWGGGGLVEGPSPPGSVKVVHTNLIAPCLALPVLLLRWSS